MLNKNISFDTNSMPSKNDIWYRGGGKFYEYKNGKWVVCYDLNGVPTTSELESIATKIETKTGTQLEDKSLNGVLDAIVNQIRETAPYIIEEENLYSDTGDCIEDLLHAAKALKDGNVCEIAFSSWEGDYQRNIESVKYYENNLTEGTIYFNNFNTIKIQYPFEVYSALKNGIIRHNNKYPNFQHYLIQDDQYNMLDVFGASEKYAINAFINNKTYQYKDTLELADLDNYVWLFDIDENGYVTAVTKADFTYDDDLCINLTEQEVNSFIGVKVYNPAT